jgi:hypothetical protein
MSAVVAEITSVTEVMDVDDTVALFEVNRTHEGQNEPHWTVMNYEGNPELTPVHQWLTGNNQEIPAYSSLTIKE